MRTTFAQRLSPSDAAAYDAFVDGAPGGSYAQTRAWAAVACAGRSLAARFFLARRDREGEGGGEGGAVVGAALVLRSRAGGLPLPVATVPRGPVVATVADLDLVLAALRRACLARGIARLGVMPYWADAAADAVETRLMRAGYKCVQTLDGAHARTLRVDLTGPRARPATGLGDGARDDLFAGKDGEALRRKLRQAEKAGVVARRGTAADLPTLERLSSELMTAQGRPSQAKSHAYFAALAPIVEEGRRGAIFVAERGGEPLSALFAARHGPLATFVVGAATTAEDKSSKMAPAMSAAIAWARSEGCAAFDLGGIPLEGDTDDKRLGIAQFKSDFAKTPVRLVREHARLF